MFIYYTVAYHVKGKLTCRLGALIIRSEYINGRRFVLLEPCIYLCLFVIYLQSTRGCMVKTKAGHRKFKFIPVSTGVANGVDANVF